MSGVSAPAALVFRRRSTMQRLSLAGAAELGAGGEARVVALPGDRSLVAKLYHQPTMERARKVALMIGEQPRISDARAAIAWPVDLLLDGRGRFAGFLMPRAEGPRLFELYNPITRRKSGRVCDPALLHRAGAHLAAVFDALHARGYVVGDVNESNVILGADGTITLVDTDSFQVRDPEEGTVHRSRVGKAEFTPPELQGRSFADFDRAPEHDRFGLGVLLFLALMEGTHPFAGRTDVRSETPPVEERIRRGLFPHHGHPEIHPPKLAPPFSVLDPALRALFVRCFADGHADPYARPTAAEWRNALTAAEREMRACERNPRHRFGPHLDACPWCERAALLHGRDPFPETPAKPAAPPTPRRTPVRAPAPARPPAPKPMVLPPRPAPVVRGDWLDDALGPSGIRHPGAWVAPAVGLVFFAGPVLKVIGLAAAAFLLLVAWMGAEDNGSDEVVPAPAGGVSIILLGLVWLFFSGLPWLLGAGAAPADSPHPAPSRYTSPAAPPAVPAPAAVEAAPERDGPYRLRLELPDVYAVDVPPELLNRDAVLAALAERAPPEHPDPVDGRVRLGVRVREDGTVDPGSVETRGVTHAGLADAARAAAPGMVFRPLTYGGRPVAPWVWFEISYERQ